MKTAFCWLFVYIFMFCACIKPPKPRVLDPLPPLQPSPTIVNGNRGNADETLPRTDGGDDLLNPEKSPAPLPEVAQTVASTPVGTPVGTPGSTEGGQPSAKKVTMKIFGGAGWFQNCVSVAMNGGRFEQIGCSKKMPQSSTECVGQDSSFAGKQVELKLGESANAQRIKVLFESYHQTATCENNTKFKYNLSLAASKFSFSTSEASVRSRFFCGSRKLENGTNQYKLCFEDSVNKDFRDIILLIEASGTEVQFEGFTPSCQDKVNFNSFANCT